MMLPVALAGGAAGAKGAHGFTLRKGGDAAPAERAERQGRDLPPCGGSGEALAILVVRVAELALTAMHTYEQVGKVALAVLDIADDLKMEVGFQGGAKPVFSHRMRSIGKEGAKGCLTKI